MPGVHSFTSVFHLVNYSTHFINAFVKSKIFITSKSWVKICSVISK